MHTLVSDPSGITRSTKTLCQNPGAMWFFLILKAKGAIASFRRPPIIKRGEGEASGPRKVGTVFIAASTFSFQSV